MIKVKELEKMVRDSRNGIPKDSRGREIKIGDVAEAEMIIEPKKVKLHGKVYSLGPKVTKICGKVIKAGAEISWIQPRNEEPKGVKNDDITIIT